MKLFSGLKTMVGIPEGLSAPPPNYLLAADGLTVSTERAQAWFLINPSSSQVLDDSERDGQAFQVISGVSKALAGFKCQLKVLWGTLSADGYEQSVSGREALIAARSENIDSWNLAKRFVLLGVDIETRSSNEFLAAIRRTTSWVSGDERGIPSGEYAALDAKMRSLAGSLATTPLRALPAPTEVLAWMIGKDNYRELAPASPRQVLLGASVKRLVSGRMRPWPNYARFFAPNGSTTAFVRYMALTQFPEDLEVPGNGEWLLTLSHIDRLTIEGEAGKKIDIHPEASVRFELMTMGESRKAALKLKEKAKEQNRAASQGVAGTASMDVQISEEEADQLGADLRRGRTSLVRLYPTISVAEANLAALDASTDAVIKHYSDLGITVEVLADEQKEAWLQGQACDQTRITDLSHVMDMEGFFGSWFWGGSVVGEDTGPAIGYTTGATSHIVRFWPSQAPLRSDAATIGIVGRSGRGKTTLMQLLALDEANNDAWVIIFDFKGDLDNEHGGIGAAAGAYGIPFSSVDVGRAFIGAADLLALSTPEEALAQSHAQLMLLISDVLKPAAQPVLLQAISDLLQSTDERTTARLIERLAASGDEVRGRIAAELLALGQDQYGAAIVGRSDGQSPLSTTPGLHLIRFPGLTPPPADVAPSEWNTAQRLHAAVVRGLLAWVTQTAGTGHLRSMRKVVCLPEAHLLTASSDGAAFLSTTARIGRALGETLILDTQDTASLADHSGIMEQISTVFAFSQNTTKQQNALAELLGLEPTDRNRKLIKEISVAPNGEPWHGHCFMRDYRNRVASMQITYPNAHIATLLDTNPLSASKGDNHVAVA